MNEQLRYALDWLRQRNQRERILLFLMVLAIVYFFWSLFIIRPIQAKQNDLTQTMQDLQTRTKDLQQQITSINNIISNKNFVDTIAKQNRLVTQTESLKKQLSNMQPVFTAPSLLPKLVSEVISQAGNVNIVDLKTLPGKPWLPTEHLSSVLPQIQNIYQHTIQLEFQSDFFSTLAFLKRLEKLHWHLFWDSLDYTVMNYPQADIKVEFHILSDQP